MATPFKIRPPEDVAFAYGFDKSKIAQAVANQDLDETSAVMAAMLIDAGRRQQSMQAGQQPTVAQQVFGGQPSAPPAGLGATPQAAAMPPMPAAPQMGMPPQEMAPQEMATEEMPMMADGGMVPPYASGGGLSDVPLPDGMFDEPNNGGYAGGGMVAFADGGMANLYDDVEYWESGGKQGAVSKAGARGVMQLMPGTMKDPGFGVTPMRDDSEAENRRAGREYLDAMYRRYGDEATALAAYNWGPGNVDKWLKKGGDPKQLPAETKKYIGNILGGKATPKIPERDINTAQGQVEGVEDIFGRLMGRFGPSEKEREIDAMRMARAEEMASPEYYEKQRKDSMWETLANIGFNMASSKAPSLLQAIGEAASAALPGAQADKKERKALKDRSLDLMVQLGAKDRKEALPLYNMAVDMKKNDIAQKNFNTEVGIKERQLDIETAQVNNQLAKILADGQGKENTKEQFIQTFYDQFVKKGYDPTLARQYAYIAAEKALAKVKGEAGALFGDEETGGTAGQKSVDQYDYTTMK